MIEQKLIVFSGLRGGAGTTSLAAMFADSLRQLNHSVLLIDLNPNDLLRLHFNVPYADQRGWAAAEAQGSPWYSQAYEITPHLSVLPYGRHGVESSQLNTADLAAITNRVWQHHNDGFFTGAHSQRFDWIIIDTPFAPNDYLLLKEKSVLQMVVVPVDIAAHILLKQYSLSTNSKLLLNRRNPTLELREAIIMDWEQKYSWAHLPISIPLDEHIPMALANKMPATTYYPESAVAKNMHSLTIWFLTFMAKKNHD